MAPVRHDIFQVILYSQFESKLLSVLIEGCVVKIGHVNIEVIYIYIWSSRIIFLDAMEIRT